jgi:phenylacetate-CoA ligase
VCEILEPGSDRVVPDGERGELVITNLGRAASPLIRYRTGDIVIRRTGTCRCGRTFARLEGGVLARADDMVNVRGVNVYPSAVEAVIRGFDQVAEYRATVAASGALRELALEIELAPGVDGSGALSERLGAALRAALGLTVPIRLVESGALPRFELKARRFVIDKGV